MSYNPGLVAKAITGGLGAAGVAAITALQTGAGIDGAEWAGIASALIVGLGVWWADNRHATYLKAATAIVLTVLAGLGTALADGSVSTAEGLTLLLALVNGINVAVTPNASDSVGIISGNPEDPYTGEHAGLQDRNMTREPDDDGGMLARVAELRARATHYLGVALASLALALTGAVVSAPQASAAPLNAAVIKNSAQSTTARALVVCQNWDGGTNKCKSGSLQKALRPGYSSRPWTDTDGYYVASGFKARQSTSATWHYGPKWVKVSGCAGCQKTVVYKTR